MFKTIFAIFALIAAAFAAPSPNPIQIPTVPVSSPVHFASSYSAPVTYGGYQVPVGYSGYSGYSSFPVHTAYSSYDTPLIYKR